MFACGKPPDCRFCALAAVVILPWIAGSAPTERRGDDSSLGWALSPTYEETAHHHAEWRSDREVRFRQSGTRPKLDPAQASHSGRRTRQVPNQRSAGGRIKSGRPRSDNGNPGDSARRRAQADHRSPRSNSCRRRHDQSESHQQASPRRHRKCDRLPPGSTRAQGTIGDNVNWVTEFDFAGGDISFKDVYGEVNLLPCIRRVRVGHMKEPFSLRGTGQFQ